MSSPWLSIDNNFPTFTGNESLREQVRLLHDFLPIMIDCLKYQLSNLGSDNWNRKEKETFQAETTEEVENAQDVTDKALAQLIKDMEALAEKVNDLSGRFADVETDVSILEKWKDEISKQVELLDKSIGQVQADQDSMEQILREDENGITLGSEGKVLKLVGTVYLNGVLLEVKEGST